MGKYYRQGSDLRNRKLYMIQVTLLPLFRAKSMKKFMDLFKYEPITVLKWWGMSLPPTPNPRSICDV